MRMTRDNGLFQCECLSLAISSLPLNLKWGTGRRSGYSVFRGRNSLLAASKFIVLEQSIFFVLSGTRSTTRSWPQSSCYDHMIRLRRILRKLVTRTSEAVFFAGWSSPVDLIQCWWLWFLRYLLVCLVRQEAKDAAHPTSGRDCRRLRRVMFTTIGRVARR